MADASARSALRDALPALVILALLAAVPLVAQWLGQPFIVKVATRVVIFAIAATALNFIVGFGGLVSLCHAGLFGIGGYVVGILAWHDFNAEPLWFLPGTSNLVVALPAAALFCAFVSAIVGAISLRTSGPYFLMITLAFNQMFYYGAVALQKYGGEDGLQIMSTMTLGPIDVSNRYRFFYLALFFLALTLFLIGHFVSSRFGMVLRAASKNAARAASPRRTPRPLVAASLRRTPAPRGLSYGAHPWTDASPPRSRWPPSRSPPPPSCPGAPPEPASSRSARERTAVVPSPRAPTARLSTSRPTAAGATPTASPWPASA